MIWSALALLLGILVGFAMQAEEGTILSKRYPWILFAAITGFILLCWMMLFTSRNPFGILFIVFTFPFGAVVSTLIVKQKKK